MKTKIATIFAILLLTLIPAEAAFRDLLGAYLNSVNNVVTILGNIKTDNDAKANLAALDAAIVQMNGAKAQLAAANVPPAEKQAAVQEKAADMQKSSAALAELTKKVRKNKVLNDLLATALAKLS